MEVESLIKVVRECPLIYDPSDRSHRDRDVIAALWKEVAAALKCTSKTTVLFTMNYVLGYELYIRYIYYELNIRLIHHEIYITRSFGLATQVLQPGKQNILPRYHELP